MSEEYIDSEQALVSQVEYRTKIQDYSSHKLAKMTLLPPFRILVFLTKQPNIDHVIHLDSLWAVFPRVVENKV